MESSNKLARKFVQKLSTILVDFIGRKMPRRAVGTMEMIKMASALRMAEIAELKENIDRLKEEILALEAAATSKGEV
jgi:polyhydroxyalkanoate synthesis regulator phasin